MKALDKIEAKAKKIAARLLETSDADIDFANGEFTVKGGDNMHGGVAQGMGRALFESRVYDPGSGQLLTGRLMDYALPRAGDLPDFRVDTVCMPCAHNPIGAKGCGEAGAIGSPPAVINAVLDALRDVGVRDVDVPATPACVRAAIQQAKGLGGAAAEAPNASMPTNAVDAQATIRAATNPPAFGLIHEETNEHVRIHLRTADQRRRRHETG